MKVFYVYCTTNIINGKKYIGSHAGQLEDKYLGSGNLLKAAVTKYGSLNFRKQILWHGPKEFREEMERYWCEYFMVGSNDMFYNINPFGGGFPYGDNNPKLSDWGREMKEERKPPIPKGERKETNPIVRKISESLKGKPSGMKGKVAWNKGATGMGGWKHSEESLQKFGWERTKIECEICGRLIGLNNIKVHIKKKHEFLYVDHSLGDKIAEKLCKNVYIATRGDEVIEARSQRKLAEILGINSGTVVSKIKSGRKTKDGFSITCEPIKKPE